MEGARAGGGGGFIPNRRPTRAIVNNLHCFSPRFLQGSWLQRSGGWPGVWQKVKDAVHHTKMGFVLLWTETKIACGLMARILKGGVLTRRELKQVGRSSLRLPRSAYHDASSGSLRSANCPGHRFFPPVPASINRSSFPRPVPHRSCSACCRTCSGSCRSRCSSSCRRGRYSCRSRSRSFQTCCQPSSGTKQPRCGTSALALYPVALYVREGNVNHCPAPTVILTTHPILTLQEDKKRAQLKVKIEMARFLQEVSRNTLRGRRLCSRLRVFSLGGVLRVGPHERTNLNVNFDLWHRLLRIWRWSRWARESNRRRTPRRKFPHFLSCWTRYCFSYIAACRWQRRVH